MTIPRARSVVGWATVALLVASVWMHSVVGWDGLAAALAAASAAPDLVASLEAGWLLGGVLLLVTAIVLTMHLRRPDEGTGRSLRIIGAGLALYGALAVIRYDGNFFFMVFVAMGAGTWFSSGGTRRASTIPS